MTTDIEPSCGHFHHLICNKSVKTIQAIHEQPKIGENFVIEQMKSHKLGEFSCLKPVISENKKTDSDGTRETNDGTLKCDFNEFQSQLQRVLMTHQDLLFTNEDNATLDQIQQVYVNHIMQHILDAQSRIIKNDKKFAKKKPGDEILRDDPSLRDQGYTRAKVLVLLPFRFSALRFGKYVQKMMGESHTIHNMDKFIQEFGEDGTDSTCHAIAYDSKKPKDFYETFRGNVDDSFRIGLKVTRRSIKFFSEFYDSDIILASPLGLKTVLTPDNPNLESASSENDFLSSIEIVVMDQAEIFLMQNWEHIMDIMEHINLMPTKPRKMDISRVHLWHLENWSRYYRQLIVFSSISVPLIHSFFQTNSLNYEGYLISRHIVDKPQARQVTATCHQQFLYYESAGAKEASDARFSFFIKKVLPRYTKDQNEDRLGHTLIVVGSYFDYVRLRNHFRREKLSFTQVCEYSEKDKIAKARQLFFFGARKALLYTERCHYYNRYAIKGVRNVLFYEPPQFPKFYSEILDMMKPEFQGKKFVDCLSPFTATTLFTKHDTLQLGAIIGYKAALELVQNKRSIP